jgi:hypothetical protein
VDIPQRIAHRQQRKINKGKQMTIDLYTWNTPNGRKISVALEEMGLPYKVHPINISKDEQFAPEFLKISPNNKIPAIVDPDGPGGKPVSIFESGAGMADVADGRLRTDAGPGASFHRARKRAGSQLRSRSVLEGDAAAL